MVPQANGAVGQRPAAPAPGGLKAVAPFQFAAICRLASFNQKDGISYVSLAPADDAGYGVEIPEGDWEVPVKCRLECELPKDIGLTAVIKCKGRFAVQEHEWVPEAPAGGRGRYAQPQGRGKVYENHRYVIESIEVVK